MLYYLYDYEHVDFVQVVEKELLIQEKEKLYMELKAILQRQPGPEVAEQLQIYQQTLKEKTKQMKVFHPMPCMCDVAVTCTVFSFPTCRAWHQN